MIGISLALLSAVTFALNNVTFRRGVLTGSVAQAMAMTVPLGTILFGLVLLAIGAFDVVLGFSGITILWFVLAGLLHFIVGRYANYRATRAVGVAVAGPVQESSLVFTLVLAIVFLGESVTLLQAIGIAVVSLAPAIMRIGRRAAKGDAASGGLGLGSVRKLAFEPNYREGFAYAVLCALSYGSSPILIGLALEAGGGVVAGLAGGFISYLAATLVLAPALLKPGMAGHLATVNRTSVIWFGASGGLVCFSQMARYMALALVPVTVVTPIQRTSLLFRLLFSRMINPDHEIINSGVVLATIISMGGVILISVDAPVIASFIGLPAGLTEYLGRSWP